MALYCRRHYTLYACLCKSFSRPDAILGKQKLTHRLFSAAPVEKKNHLHVKTFFRSTRMDGGAGKASKGKVHTTSAILEIMQRENCQLYYLQNNIPIEMDK